MGRRNKMHETMKEFPINHGSAYDSLSNDLERYFYMHYFNQMFEYAINMFNWKNLPDRIPAKFIERILCTIGYGAFGTWFDERVFMKCTLMGPLDIYYEPKNIRLFANEGVGFDANQENSVICYNNYMRQPTAFYLETYAARMAKAEAFIHVNMNACKTPLIFSVRNNNQLLTLKNAYAKYEGNTPVIFEIGNMGLSDDIKAINTGAPWLVSEAQTYKKQTWDEAMAFLGIRNVDSEKRERLVTAEADGNIQQIEMARMCLLNARREAVDKVNDMWGTDIDVDFALVTNYGNGIFGHTLTDDLLEGGGLLGNNDAFNAIDRDSESGQPNS